MRRIRNILVLSSEVLVADMITRHLKRKGIKLTTAEDDDEVREMIAESVRAGTPFDLVIGDLFTPRIDGISFFRWLINSHPALPVLVLCGYGTLDVTMRMLRPNQDGFCRKPLTPEALWSAVQKIKAGGQAQQSAGLAESLR